MWQGMRRRGKAAPTPTFSYSIEYARAEVVVLFLLLRRSISRSFRRWSVRRTRLDFGWLDVRPFADWF